MKLKSWKLGVLAIFSSLVVACGTTPEENTNPTEESETLSQTPISELKPASESPHSTEIVFGNNDMTMIHAVPDNFKGSGFLQADIEQRSFPVAYIYHGALATSCTGTLIDKDLVLTNGHCVGANRGTGAEYAVGDNGFQVIFNYQHINGNAPDPIALGSQSSEFAYEVEAILENGRRAGFQWDNDYAILQLRQAPICVRVGLCPTNPVGNLGRAGDNFGVTPLRNTHPEYGEEFVSMIQHPLAWEKRVDVGTITGPYRLWTTSQGTFQAFVYDGLYRTNTIDMLSGSSGSGLLGARGRLFGINTYAINGTDQLYDPVDATGNHTANGWNAAVAIERLQQFSPIIQNLLNRTIIRGDYTGDNNVDQWDHVVLQAYINEPTNDLNLLNTNAHALDGSMPSNVKVEIIPQDFNADFTGEGVINADDAIILDIYLDVINQINSLVDFNTIAHNSPYNLSAGIEIQVMPETGVLGQERLIGDITGNGNITSEDTSRLSSCLSAESLAGGRGASPTDEQFASAGVTAEQCSFLPGLSNGNLWLIADVTKNGKVTAADTSRLSLCLSAENLAGGSGATPTKEQLASVGLDAEKCSFLPGISIGDITGNGELTSEDSDRLASCLLAENLAGGSGATPTDGQFASAGVTADQCSFLPGLGNGKTWMLADLTKNGKVTSADKGRLSLCLAAESLAGGSGETPTTQQLESVGLDAKKCSFLPGLPETIIFDEQ